MGQKRKKINGKELVLDISYDIVGSVLYALGIYTFAKTADFAPGGLSGLALIMNHLWRFPIGITTLALNIPLIILSFKLVGRRFMFKSARTMIVCTIFLDLIFPYTKPYTGEPFMAALFSGVCLGAALALFYAGILLRRYRFSDYVDQSSQAAFVNRICNHGDRSFDHSAWMAGIWKCGRSSLWSDLGICDICRDR